MSNIDYYGRLGVPQDASIEEIRQAYRKLARQLHPDANPEVHASEAFLRVQEAYDILSDPQLKDSYDRSLPPPPQYIRINLHSSISHLPKIDEAELVYALVELQAPNIAETVLSSPLNVCLVLDCSTSMKGTRLDTVKVTAIEILRKLRPQDILSVVIFSDRAKVLFPAGHRFDLKKAEITIQMLDASGATEIFQGLQAGYQEVQKHVNVSSINHVILLTDGHTYGDEAKCLALAKQANEQGIGISGLGIGSEWNDTFMDQLVSITGGSSIFIARDKDIKGFLEREFFRLYKVYANSVRYRFKQKAGVELQYAFRIQPEPSRLSVTREAGENVLEIGSLPLNMPLSFILELLVQPFPGDVDEVTLLDGRLRMDILPEGVVDFSRRLLLGLPIHREVVADSHLGAPPAVIVQALSRLNLYRMQEQARLDLSAGDIPQAAQRLKSLATHLFSQGEQELAHTVLREAKNVQQKHALSAIGSKYMKYGTRSLMLPATVEDVKP